MTVTIRAADLDSLTAKARERTLRTKAVHVSGRFHTPNHSHVVEKLMELVSRKKGLQFSDRKELKSPICDTANGGVISGGSFTRFALRSPMVNVADWYATLGSSIQQLPKANQTIAFAGFGSCIPASLVRNPGLDILALSNLQMSKPKIDSGLPNDHVKGSADGVYTVEGFRDLSEYPSHSIAIVGVAGRLPGADSVDELWDLIMEGKTMVEPAPVEPQTYSRLETMQT